MLSLNLVVELLKNTHINKYTIKLVDRKQPPYESINTFDLVKLETLNTYIKTHPKTSFICPSNSLANTLILSNKKPDSSLYF